MSSVVDICNLALAHLGDVAQVASITPPDGSAQSAHCARFYPIARDEVLEAHAWHFATTRAVLADTTAVYSPPGDWLYSYALPSMFLRALAVLPEAAADDADGAPYQIEVIEDGTTKVLYTNVPVATLRYVRGVTDPTRFSPMFVSALSRLLASYLAGPIIKGQRGTAVAKDQLQLYRATLGMAEASDANSQRTRVYADHRPSWTTDR